jgi:4-hydroxybenzoate polyprenyltransferase
MAMDRENAVGVLLLGLCAIVAVLLAYSIASGTRFRLEGPAWLGTALVILFIAGTLYAFVRQPGRRWPWQRDRNQDQEER